MKDHKEHGIRISAMLMALALTGCGGGGGSSPSIDPPEDNPEPQACVELDIGQTVEVEAPPSPANIIALLLPARTNVGDAQHPDKLAIQLLYDFEAGPGAGMVALGTGDNANFSTCKQCVLFFEDMRPDDSTAKAFFAESGTMRDDSNLYNSSGQLTDVRLIQVTIDRATGRSTPVPNGACYTLESLYWTINF